MYRQDRNRKKRSKNKAEPLNLKESTPARFLINLVLAGGREAAIEESKKHSRDEEGA